MNQPKGVLIPPGEDPIKVLTRYRKFGKTGAGGGLSLQWIMIIAGGLVFGFWLWNPLHWGQATKAAAASPSATAVRSAVATQAPGASGLVEFSSPTATRPFSVFSTPMPLPVYITRMPSPVSGTASGMVIDPPSATPRVITQIVVQSLPVRVEVTRLVQQPVVMTAPPIYVPQVETAIVTQLVTQLVTAPPVQVTVLATHLVTVVVTATPSRTPAPTWMSTDTLPPAATATVPPSPTTTPSETATATDTPSLILRPSPWATPSPSDTATETPTDTPTLTQEAYP